MGTRKESLQELLNSAFQEAFTALGFEARWGAVTVSDRPDLAHYQCNGALGAAKSKGAKPRELADAVVVAVRDRIEKALQSKQFELSIAGPGFINVKVGDAPLAAFASAAATDSRCGVRAMARKRTVVVDYGGPNVAKSMHVGHLRSSIIGDAIVRLYRFMGDEVIGDNHLGDWGTPMGMLICEIKRAQPGLPYFDAGFSGKFPAESPVTMEDLEMLYPVASKRFKEDEAFKAEVLVATDQLQQGSHRGYRALWQHFVDTTIAGLNRDFGRLGIAFDRWYGESFYEDKMPALVEELKRGGFTEMSDGALVVPLATPEQPETPPLILVKSGGGYLYHTSDLATVQFRARELKADLALYAVDKRQALHFKQVFEVAQRTGITKNPASGAAIELFHSGFGTMNGKDGKPFKTREGGVLKLKDFIEMVNAEARKRVAEIATDRQYDAAESEAIAEKVGIATLKYADLKNNRMMDYVFDLERFSQFEGNTGPYLLYATVRIQSILKKAAEAGFVPGATVAAPTVDSERRLILEMVKLPEVVGRAYSLVEPHHLADYGFALAQAFNSFYKDCHILREEDPARRAGWLLLCRGVHAQLVLCLGLLGISVPERM